MDLSYFRKRLATEAELQEGRRQIEEAERRMTRQGIEVVLGDGLEERGGAIEDEPPQHVPIAQTGPRSGPELQASRGEALKIEDKEEGEVPQSEDETELRVEVEAGREEGRGLGRSQQAEENWTEAVRGGMIHQQAEEQMMPLFNEEQLRRLEQLERSAPMLMRTEPSIPRPKWMLEEEKKAEEIRKEKERLKELREQQRIAVVMKNEQHAMVMEKIYNLEKENAEMKKAWEDSQVENLRMKERIKMMSESPLYETPKEEASGKGKAGGDEEERRREGFVTPKPGRSVGGEKRDINEMSMELMVRMMESMQNMMSKKSPEVEAVRPGHHEIPKLAEWSVDSAPLDLGDCLIMLDPVMGDLSSTSHLWWQKVMEEARSWYEEHQRLSPLDRVSHRPLPSPELADGRWMRLERRATSLLLSALPELQKEEMVATKNLTPLSMVTRLMTIYQPGGLSEKAIILKALEQPQEASCLSSALVGLRRWLRWKRRAAEVQVALPDASVLVKGLNKLVKKVLEANKELGFRINLAKTTLLVESIPREETVHQLAEHLVAEIEAIAHLEMKTGKGEKTEVKPVLKKFEEWKGGEKGGNRGGGGQERTPITCRFFISDAGCKKGKAMPVWTHLG